MRATPLVLASVAGVSAVLAMILWPRSASAAPGVSTSTPSGWDYGPPAPATLPAGTGARSTTPGQTNPCGGGYYSRKTAQCYASAPDAAADGAL